MHELDDVEEPAMVLPRYRGADEAVQWTDLEMLDDLVEVMGIVRRLNSTESSHYLATKVLELVQAALTLRAGMFDHFADAAETAPNEMDATPIGELRRTIEAVEILLTAVMWSKAWGEPICQVQATALCEVTAALSAWAQKVQAAALRDSPEQ